MKAIADFAAERYQDDRPEHPHFRVRERFLARIEALRKEIALARAAAEVASRDSAGAC